MNSLSSVSSGVGYVLIFVYLCGDWAGLVETPQQMEFVLNVIALDKRKRTRVLPNHGTEATTPRPWYRQVWIQHMSGVILLLIIVVVVSYFMDLGDPAAATARKSLIHLHTGSPISGSGDGRSSRRNG
jgi:hypothetical protein